MDIIEIKTLEDMERYILERNRVIDCFDSLVLQSLMQNMKENQLVLIFKKDYFYNVTIEKILDWYRPYIEHQYSKSLPIMQGFISECNEVWFRIPKAIENPWNAGERMSELSRDNYYVDDNIIWYQEWLNIRDSRMKNKVSILYEDDSILIFVIFVKVDKIKFNNETQGLEFNHPIYGVNPELQWQIYLTDHYYHHYKVKGYDEFLHEQGQEYIKERLEKNKEILEFYRKEFTLERKRW